MTVFVVTRYFLYENAEVVGVFRTRGSAEAYVARSQKEYGYCQYDVIEQEMEG
jgi:hypothetical protein